MTDRKSTGAYDPVKIRVKFHQEDAKSYLYSIQGNHRYGRWFPKDKVVSRVPVGNNWFIVTVPRWLAEDRKFPLYVGGS